MPSRLKIALAMATLLAAGACSSSPKGPTLTKHLSSTDNRIQVSAINTLSSGSGPIVVGEVRNTSSATVGGVHVTVSIASTSGTPIGQPQDAYVLLQDIPPGGKAPFSATFLEEQGTVGSVSATAAAPDQVPLQTVPVSVTDKHGSLLGSDYQVTGTVANSSSSPVHFANVVATFFDSGGTIVGAVADGGTGDTVAPGGTASFRITLVDEGLRVSTYKLVAEAGVVASGH